MDEYTKLAYILKGIDAEIGELHQMIIERNQLKNTVLAELNAVLAVEQSARKAKLDAAEVSEAKPAEALSPV